MLTLIVEGKGEEFALPVLIEKAQSQHLLPGLPDIQYIAANGKPNILRDNPKNPGLEGFIRRYSAMCNTFIVLLDDDRTFPPYLGHDDHDLTLEHQQLPLRAHRIAENLDVRVFVCWAKWELESWLIGGLRKGEIECDEGLGQFIIRFAIPEDTSNRPREAKGWLLKQFSKRKEENYTPSVVECLALHVNIQEAHRRNPTLREFFDVLRQIATE